MFLEKANHLALEGKRVFAIKRVAERIADVVQAEAQQRLDFRTFKILAARVAHEAERELLDGVQKIVESRGGGGRQRRHGRGVGRR